MKFMGRFFATIFAFVFIVASVLALLLFNVNANLVSPGHYKAVLADKKIYDRLPPLAAKFFVDSSLRGGAARSGAPSEGPSPGQVELTTALAATLPASVLQTAGETTIDRLFALLDGKADTVTAPLGPIKAAVAGGAPAAFHKVIDSKPNCTARQLKALDMAMMLQCKAPAKLAVADNLGKSVADAVGKLPDEASVVSAAAAAGMQENLKMARQARTAMVWSPLVPLLALLLIAAATVRSKASAMRWLGTPLLITGLIGAAGISAAGPLLDKALADKLSPEHMPTLGPDVRAIALDVTGGLTHGFISSVLLQSGLIALLGLGLIFAAASAAKKSKKPRGLAD